MNTPVNSEATANNVVTTPWFKSKKLWTAIPLALVLMGMNYFIYTPAIGIAGMLTDSCSGDSNAYIMWEIWLAYLWPLVMLIGSLVPAYLVFKKRVWWKVVLGVFICGVFSIFWYLLWAPVMWITGC